MAIQLGATDGWTKSTHSAANGECVEVRSAASDTISVRDSKVPDGPVLNFEPASWSAFIAEVTGGHLRPE